MLLKVFRFPVSACLFIFVFCNAHAAVYKWVDKEGNVQYSQMPPPVTQEVTPTLRSNSWSGVSSIKPLRTGDKIFCGRLEVTELSISDTALKENLRLVIDAWVKKRNELDRRRLNLSAETPLDKRLELDNQYAEQSCRVNWVHAKLKTLDSFAYKSNNSYQALKNEYDRLKSLQEEECSTDPKKLGKTMLIGKEANEWGKCYDGYRYKMRDIKAKMKENRQSLRDAY